jgi:hypothetical protein
MVRRSIAAGAGLLVLFLLVVGVRGCLDARKERAFKDYVRDVGALLQESDQQSDGLFRLLSSSDQGDVEIQNSLNMVRQQSEVLVDRARSTDHPDDLGQAQRYLVETLELRRDGIGGIADALPPAIARQQDRRRGTRRIAEQMQLFLASDVVYLRRMAPSLERSLEDEELGDERVPRSQFLPNVDWLQPDTVADRVGKLGGGGGGGQRSGEAAPGLHGNGLAGATLGGQALSPGGSANVRLSDDLALEAQVANQGENTETDVKVNVTIGKGGDAIKLEKVLDEIAAGETKTVTIPIAERPPTGQNVPIVVEVEAVPGEEKTDNNKGEFAAIFTR